LQSIARDPQGLHDVHGPWEFQGVTGQCALYNQGASLLHSEFGVEGLTNLRTLNRIISPDKQSPVSLDNPVWEHLGAWWVKTESWRQAFGDLPDVETTVKATQFLQAAGLGYAVEADRRRKYHNSGTLPWQFNEPYPMAASTSAVDYFTLPKPAYYAVKRAYAPLTVSAQFPTLAWGGQPAFEAQAWVSNSRQVGAEHVMLHMALVGAGGRIYASQEQEVAFAGNVSTCLADCRWSLDKVLDEVFFLDLRLTGEDGQNLAANRYIFGRSQNLAPLLRVRETHLAVSDQPQGDHCRLQIANTGQFAALFVWLEDDLFEQKFRWQMDEPVESFYFEDNGFCLLPGESRVVAAVGEEDGAFKMGRLLVSAWNAHKEQVDMPRVGIRRGVPELEKVG
jgi:beta-mannosidase